MESYQARARQEPRNSNARCHKRHVALSTARANPRERDCRVTTDQVETYLDTANLKRKLQI